MLADWFPGRETDDCGSFSTMAVHDSVAESPTPAIQTLYCIPIGNNCMPIQQIIQKVASTIPLSLEDSYRIAI